MSAAKKSKAGTVHKKTKQKPVHQGDADAQPEPNVPAKPDFDAKDENISPKRKAPGPVKRRRRSRGAASQSDAPGDSAKRPEANIKDDHDS